MWGAAWAAPRAVAGLPPGIWDAGHALKHPHHRDRYVLLGGHLRCAVLSLGRPPLGICRLCRPPPGRRGGGASLLAPVVRIDEGVAAGQHPARMLTWPCGVWALGSGGERHCLVRGLLGPAPCSAFRQLSSASGSVTRPSDCRSTNRWVPRREREQATYRF